LVEHSLGKGEVTSSILVIGSRRLVLYQGMALAMPLDGIEEAALAAEVERE
jgi:hypothetical protein